MNPTIRLLSILVLSAAAPLAYAHDPKEHAREAAAAKAGPDCAAMKDMDPSKMDPNDPVMKAMMARCGAAPDHGATTRGSAAPAASPHDHGGH